MKTLQDLIGEVQELNDYARELSNRLNLQGMIELSAYYTEEQIRLVEEYIQFLKKIINDLTLIPEK